MAETREDLVEKARSEYGIVNADQMSDEQLRAEVKAIDDQSKPEQKEKKANKQAKKQNDKQNKKADTNGR